MSTLLLGLTIALVATAAMGLAKRASLGAAPVTPGHPGMQQDSLARLSPAELREWLREHPGAVVLDVRTPAEFAAGHLAGAVNLDVQAPDFASHAEALARETAYVVYCRSGVRSDRAGRLLLGLGHQPVVNAGGYEPLARAGFATDGGSMR